MSSKRSAEAGQLGGALAQLEVAEAALRDSQGTASRLLQASGWRALVGKPSRLPCQLALHGDICGSVCCW